MTDTKNYQINDRISGFTVTRIRKIPHVQAVLHELTHDVTGASLIYVQTEDINKLFSVAFKTIPADDTGVFHILEHSRAVRFGEVSSSGAFCGIIEIFHEYLPQCPDFSG